jgi:hypothetical protein
MSEATRANLKSPRRAPPREAPPIEAIRDCITPIMTSTTIARSLADDRRQQLALDIIERQTKRLVHVLKEAFGAEFGADPRPD